MSLVAPLMVDDSHALFALRSKRKYPDTDPAFDAFPRSSSIEASALEEKDSGWTGFSDTHIERELSPSPQAKRPALGLETISSRLRALDLISNDQSAAQPAPSSAQNAIRKRTVTCNDDGDYTMLDAACTKRQKVKEIRDEDSDARPWISVIDIPLHVRAKAFLDEEKRQKQDKAQEQSHAPPTQAMVLYRPQAFPWTDDTDSMSID